MELTAEAVLHEDGSGQVALEMVLDAELLAELDAMELDPTVDAAAVAQRSDEWSMDRRIDDDGALRLVFSRPISEPAELGEVFRRLTERLSAEDPSVVIDVDAQLFEDGRSTVSGDAMLRAPGTAGFVLDGRPLGPSASELRDLVDGALDARFTVELPGRVVTSNADEVEGGRLTWHLPVGQTRSIEASAAPRSPQAPWWPLGFGAMILITAIVLAVRVFSPRGG